MKNAAFAQIALIVTSASHPRATGEASTRNEEARPRLGDSEQWTEMHSFFFAVAVYFDEITGFQIKSNQISCVPNLVFTTTF